MTSVNAKAGLSVMLANAVSEGGGDKSVIGVTVCS